MQSIGSLRPEAVKPPSLLSHPLQHGEIIVSPGCHFSYRVVGPCCRLFDREQLPWPCCRLQWRGKEPSWRRVGRRFVPDLATKGRPSYAVEIIGQGALEPLVITFYSVKLPAAVKVWWHSDKAKQTAESIASGGADETIVEGYTEPPQTGCSTTEQPAWGSVG